MRGGVEAPRGGLHVRASLRTSWGRTGRAPGLRSPTERARRGGGEGRGGGTTRGTIRAHWCRLPVMSWTTYAKLECEERCVVHRMS